MPTTLTQTHLLSLAELSAGEIHALFDLAHDLKGRTLSLAAGKTLGLVFTKPSTRTRVSFEVAMNQLGGHTVFLAADATQLSRGEPMRDTARVLGRYVDAIAMRTHHHADVEILAAESGVPVANALTDLYHPTQVLADLLTVRDARGSLENLTVAWVGDGNNMCHTWILAQAILGFTLKVAAPPAFRPKATVLCHPLVEAHPPLLLTDVDDAVAGADVVTTDTWVSMGDEDDGEWRREVFAPYQVNEALMATAARDALFLHCLPAHAGEEVTEEVLYGPRSVVWDEAENRLHVQKAWLAAVLTA